MSFLPPPERCNRTSQTARQQHCENVLNSQIDDFFTNDEVNSFQELVDKIQLETLPCDVLAYSNSSSILFYLIDMEIAPQLSFSLHIRSDLTWLAWIDRRPITASQLKILPSKVLNVSSVLNALALLKSIRNKDEPLNWLDSAIASLEAACKTASNKQQSKLHFLSEQASLLKKQNNFRCSPSLMVSAYSLLSVST